MADPAPKISFCSGNRRLQKLGIERSPTVGAHLRFLKADLLVLTTSPCLRYDVWVGKWCTVTVANSEGRRYSLDVNATTSNPGCGMPIPTTAITFEIVADGRILHVSGARLKTWIEHRREEWKGPRGILFNQRPMIGD